MQTFGFADNTEAAKVTFWQGIYLFRVFLGIIYCTSLLLIFNLQI